MAHDPFNPLVLPDFPETDESGDVDLEQIDYNLSLTPAQRFAHYFRWLEFMRDARDAAIKHYGMDPRPPAAIE